MYIVIHLNYHCNYFLFILEFKNEYKKAMEMSEFAYDLAVAKGMDGIYIMIYNSKRVKEYKYMHTQHTHTTHNTHITHT